MRIFISGFSLFLHHKASRKSEFRAEIKKKEKFGFGYFLKFFSNCFADAKCALKKLCYVAASYPAVSVSCSTYKTTAQLSFHLHFLAHTQCAHQFFKDPLSTRIIFLAHTQGAHTFFNHRLSVHINFFSTYSLSASLLERTRSMHINIFCALSVKNYKF